MVEENLVEKVKIYGATWGRPLEDGRVSTQSEGYYFSPEAVKQVLRELEERLGSLGFQGGSVISRNAIKVGLKAYNGLFEYTRGFECRRETV